MFRDLAIFAPANLVAERIDGAVLGADNARSLLGVRHAREQLFGGGAKAGGCDLERFAAVRNRVEGDRVVADAAKFAGDRCAEGQVKNLNIDNDRRKKELNAIVNLNMQVLSTLKK